MKKGLLIKCRFLMVFMSSRCSGDVLDACHIPISSTQYPNPKQIKAQALRAEAARSLSAEATHCLRSSSSQLQGS